MLKRTRDVPELESGEVWNGYTEQDVRGAFVDEAFPLSVHMGATELVSQLRKILSSAVRPKL